MEIIADSAGELIVGAIREVMTKGKERSSRGCKYREILNPTLVLTNPLNNLYIIPSRKNNPFAMIGETLWVYAGRSDTFTLKNLLHRANDFSDDNLFWRGGYGNRLFYPVNQIESCFDKIKQDPETRQAVMTIFQPLDAMAVPANQAEVGMDQFRTKDVPCNDLIQFLMRDDELHMSTYCRSNDAIWGLSGINLYEFTFLQQAMASALGVKVGTYTHRVGSLHIYDQHYERAETIIESGYSDVPEASLNLDYDDIREFLLDCQKTFAWISGGMFSDDYEPKSKALKALATFVRLFYLKDTEELMDKVEFFNKDLDTLDAYRRVFKDYYKIGD